MIDVSVTILKVDVHNIFLKCVNTNYEVEQKMKKKNVLTVKRQVMAIELHAKNTSHRF